MDQYNKPVVLLTDDMAEGIYAASGAEAGGSSSECSYTNPSVTINERDFNTSKYRVTIKADHVGTVNDRKGAIVTLTSSVNLSGFVVRTGSFSCNESAGTSFTITYNGSHHSELNCEVEFTADAEPVLGATATPLV